MYIPAQVHEESVKVFAACSQEPDLRGESVSETHSDACCCCVRGIFWLLFNENKINLIK